MATTLSVLLKMTDQVSDKFKEISNSGQYAVDALKGVQETADRAFERVSNGTDEAAGALQKVSASASELNTEFESMNHVAEEAEEATSGYADSAAEAAAAMDDSVKATQEAADAVGEYADETGKSAQQTDEWKDSNVNAMQMVNNAIVAAGIAKLLSEVTDAFAECTEAARNFETSAAMLTTIAGKENIGGLKDEIAELSKQSGASQKQLAEVAYSAISAGAAIEDSVEMAEQASLLATAGFTDEASALRVLTTALNSYGDEAGTAEQISDSLIQVQNLGVTTVAELAQQMGRSISTAAAYNVSLGNLESAYISTTKAGIATAESTTYISGMIAELGKEGSDVAKTLQDETGKSFGQLMNDGNSLADVLGLLYDSAGKDAEAFANMWGSQTASKAALAIVNQGLETFNDNLISVENAAGATREAYEIMADTGEMVNMRLNNSVDNLRIAIGDDLLPVVNDFKRQGTEVIDGITDFVNDNPEIVQAIATVTGAVGVFVGTLATATAGVTLLNGVLGAFGIAADLALGPVALVTAAVAGLTAGGILLHDMIKANIDEGELLTHSSQVQQDEIERLNEKYEEAVKKYGETSEEALRLKYQVDDLTESYEGNKQTIDQVLASSQSLCDQVAQNVEAYKKEQDAIKENSNRSLVMAQRLKDLAQYGHGTAAEYEEMKLIIEQLNAEYEDYNETLSRVMSTAGNSTKTVLELAQAEADRRTQQSKVDNYIETLTLQNEALEAQKELEADLVDAKQRLSDAEQDYFDKFNLINAGGTNMFAGLSMYWSEENANLELAQEHYDDIKAKLDEVNTAVSSNNGVLEEQRKAFEAIGEAAGSTAEVEVSSQEQAGQAVDQIAASLQKEAEALAAAYQKAHEDIRNAINGTFGLFDEVKTESTTTTDQMVKGLQSQNQYLNEYKDNIEKAKNAGLSDALLTELSDGSKSSADNLKAIVEELENLGTGSKEAKDLVTKLNEEFAKVVESKKTLEDTLVEMNGTLKTQTDELVDTMTQAVKDMNLSDDAAASAKSTLEAYASNIRTSGADAVTAANEIATQVSNALASAKSDLAELKSVANEANNTANSIKNNPNNPNQQTEASGTIYSPETFIAGEAGAELITNRLGSTVFPASETAKVIRAVHEFDLPKVPQEVKEVSVTEKTMNMNSKRDVTLHIDTADLQVSGGLSLASVETFLNDNIRPTLLNVLAQEAMEEGDFVYEF